jgi:hypothetical protein
VPPPDLMPERCAGGAVLVVHRGVLRYWRGGSHPNFSPS